jgi:hypothetical protein
MARGTFRIVPEHLSQLEIRGPTHKRVGAYYWVVEECQVALLQGEILGIVRATMSFSLGSICW